MTLEQSWKERGKSQPPAKAFVLSDSHVLGGGRPAGTHYTPLASAKAVTLTNSQCHNGTVVQFVFSLNPHYVGHTKAAGPDFSNVPQQRTCTKLHFLSFLRKRKGRSCCFVFFFSFFFNPPRLITDTFWVFFGRGCGGSVYDESVESVLEMGNKLRGWAFFRQQQRC